MTHQAVGSSFANGARIPNWVNGRLLTAEDLATERDTLLARDTLIGQAAGYGVVSGLWVSGGGTTLGVTSGLGLNRQGNPVRLGADTSLGLVLTAPASAPTDTGRFANCTLAPSPTTSIAAGAYLLTALPTSQFEGQASLNRPPGQQSSPGCVSQWEVEGVSFKAIRLGVDVTGSTVKDTIRRSLLAHWCFGSARLSGLGVDPFHFDAAYTGLDQVDPADLTLCDLPLAVFYWTGSAVGFVDNWPARRRIVRDDPRESGWSAVISDKRLAEGRARFLQFQQQADDLVATGAAGVTHATDVFEYLPPAGFLPVKANSTHALLTKLAGGAPGTPGGGFSVPGQVAPGTLPHPIDIQVLLSALAATTAPAGFDIETFFSGIKQVTLGGSLPWDEAEAALQRSWYEQALPVTSSLSLSYYFIQENLKSPRPYIFFAKPPKAAPVPEPKAVRVFVGIAGNPLGGGYWLVASDGSVFAFGTAVVFTPPPTFAGKKVIVGIDATPGGDGYWLVDSSGNVFAFGGANLFLPTNDFTPSAPIVGIAATRTGRGYWLAAADGGVFAFGDAQILQSSGPTGLQQPIAGITATPIGWAAGVPPSQFGYWLVDARGGVSAFGDARVFPPFVNTLILPKPIVGMAASPTPVGYWLAASDGRVFTCGDAEHLRFPGGPSLAKPVVGIASAPPPGGFWLVDAGGGVFSFGGGAGYFGSPPTSNGDTAHA